MDLPIWFLLLSLALPRIALLAGVFFSGIPALNVGWVSGTLAVLVPRALILILIFQDRGMSGWLLIHVWAMASVYYYMGKSDGSPGAEHTRYVEVPAPDYQRELHI